MIGIYNDYFLDYLKSNLLGVVTNSKNIICQCPWCEMNSNHSHYHLWISIELPIFNCFSPNCPVKSGHIGKIVSRISGTDFSKKFIDEEKIKEFDKNIVSSKKKYVKKILLPEINIKIWPEKNLYLKRRLRFSSASNGIIKGLIFDINKFIEINKIKLEDRIEKFKDYLHSNFIGFLTEHNSSVIFRNIDRNSEFKHFKLKIQDSFFLDYYKLSGGNDSSNTIVLGEGVFDIYSEYIFDKLEIKNNCNLYAANLSANSYHAILKSIAFHEQIFRQDVHIISDNGIDLKFYENLKKYNKHIIEKLTVYYNRSGKDFNEMPINTVRFCV